MASNNTNNSRNQQQHHQNNEEKGSWLVPGLVGVALGAGLAYMFGKSQSEGCSQQRHTNSSRPSNFEAAPRGCCSICRDDYEATITLGCGHILHRDCYQDMKRAAGRGVVLCPLCRKRAE